MENQNSATQIEVVLNHLKEGKELSQYEATFKYGILRLGAIIHILRKEGYNIVTKLEHKPNRYGHNSNYAVYQLIRKDN